jgi:hypothetical protein
MSSCWFLNERLAATGWHRRDRDDKRFVLFSPLCQAALRVPSESRSRRRRSWAQGDMPERIGRPRCRLSAHSERAPVEMSFGSVASSRRWRFERFVVPVQASSREAAGVMSSYKGPTQVQPAGGSDGDGLCIIAAWLSVLRLLEHTCSLYVSFVWCTSGIGRQHQGRVPVRPNPFPSKRDRYQVWSTFERASKTTQRMPGCSFSVVNGSQGSGCLVKSK